MGAFARRERFVIVELDSVSVLRARVAEAAVALGGAAEEGASVVERLGALRPTELSGRPGAEERLVELGRALLLLDGVPAQEGARAPARSNLTGLCRALYAVECSAGGPARSTLYQGLTQIAHGRVELGVQQVQGGLERHAARLDPIDRGLAWWGLASAAVQHRSMTHARTLVERWCEHAHLAGLGVQLARGELLRLLLQLLFDEGVDEAELARLPAQAPAGWEGPLRRLWEWRERRAPLAAVPAALTAAGPELPLVLGLSWAGEGDPRKDIELHAGSFAALTRVRSLFAREESLQDEGAPILAWLVELYASWDLRRPLEAAGRALRGKASHAFYGSLLARHLGEHAGHVVLGAGGGVEADEREAIVLMSDVQGYSDLCEGVEPRGAHEMLSPLFKVMNEELESVGGMILEFVGDCIMVVFNAFDGQSSTSEEVLRKAARCVRRVHLLGALLWAQQRPRLRLGVGIHRGPVARGYLGGLRRCHLAVLGATVNLAARLESLTRSLPSSIAVSEEALGGPPDAWARPEQVSFALRDLGCEHPLKGIARRVRVYGVDPLVRHWVDFVPMGFVATPEPGVVYLDTGCAWGPGIVDTHTEDEREELGSACGRVLARPDFVVEHLRRDGNEVFELRVHEEPDLDCVASLYACYELLAAPPRRLHTLHRLAAYVSEIDRGSVPCPERITDSLYGVFQAHLQVCEDAYRAANTRLDDLGRLEAGLRVVDAAVFLAEAEGETCDFSCVFAERPGWFSAERELLKKDRQVYLEKDRPRARSYLARVAGAPGPLEGIWLDHPESLLFKQWARTDPEAPSGRGFPFMAVDWSKPGKGRFVISVAPDSGLHLDGLGPALEALESVRRRERKQERPLQPRRWPADNSDPWYFGQGHGYTIVDSPNGGTILTGEEVQRVHEAWVPPGPMESPPK